MGSPDPHRPRPPLFLLLYSVTHTSAPGLASFSLLDGVAHRPPPPTGLAPALLTASRLRPRSRPPRPFLLLSSAHRPCSCLAPAAAHHRDHLCSRRPRRPRHFDRYRVGSSPSRVAGLAGLAAAREHFQVKQLNFKRTPRTRRDQPGRRSCSRSGCAAYAAAHAASSRGLSKVAAKSADSSAVRSCGSRVRASLEG